MHSHYDLQCSSGVACKLPGLCPRAWKSASPGPAPSDPSPVPPCPAVLKRFQSHLRFGGKLELLALTELPDVDEATARLLYNAGGQGGAAGIRPASVTSTLHGAGTVAIGVQLSSQPPSHFVTCFSPRLPAGFPSLQAMADADEDALYRALLNRPQGWAGACTCTGAMAGAAPQPSVACACVLCSRCVGVP